MANERQIAFTITVTYAEGRGYGVEMTSEDGPHDHSSWCKDAALVTETIEQWVSEWVQS